MAVNIFYDNVDFKLNNVLKIKRLIKFIVQGESIKLGSLNYIFTNKDNILKINNEFLKHDYYTDVISFNTSENNTLNGEIYICYEVVQENASKYNVDSFNEVLRVMIHGLLHLLGLKDSNEEEQKIIHEREDYWMALFYRDNLENEQVILSL